MSSSKRFQNLFFYSIMLITAISVAMAGGFNDKILKGINTDSMVFGQQLINAIITKENDISFMECIQQCVNYKRCKSVNYLRSFLQCELNYEEEVRDREEISFISNSNVIFSRIKEWKKIENIPCKDVMCGVNEICTKIADDYGVCTISDCGPASQSVRNAYVETQNGIGMYSKITFKCKDGKGLNMLIGIPHTTCTATGEWSKPRFHCYVGNVGVPSFVSDWITMKANTRESDKLIQHSCNGIPMKVDVQVKPFDNVPNGNFVFGGLGSSLTDDDYAIYGGVLFMYNSSHVRVMAPHKNNNYIGKIIFTGGGEWNGPYKLEEEIARVRVRCWCDNDMADPAFESSWIPVSVYDSKHFKEVPVKKVSDIALSVLRIKLGNTEWITEGLGSSSASVSRRSVNFGGVIYGFTSENMRIWLPRNHTSKIYSSQDGWSQRHGIPNVFKHGYVKVLIWSMPDDGIFRKEFFVSSSTDYFSQAHEFGRVDLRNDLVYVTVKMLHGNNKNYSFPAQGMVQESLPNYLYGGVAYSYSNESVCFWRPRKGGYIAYIGPEWGDADHEHKETEGILEVRSWKTKYIPWP